MLLAVLIASGCGDSADDVIEQTRTVTLSSTIPATSPTTAVPEPTPTSTTVPTPDPEADEAFAEYAIVQLEDLPSGWLEVPIEEADDDSLWFDDLTFGVPACAEVPYEPPRRRVPDAEREYEIRSFASEALFADVSVLENEDDAEAAMAALRSDAMDDCINAIVGRFAQMSGRLGSATVVEVQRLPGSEGGDDAIQWLAQIDVQVGEGPDATVFVDVYEFEYVRVGRHLIALVSNALDVPASTHPQAVDAMVERLEAGPPAEGLPELPPRPTVPEVETETVTVFELEVGTCFNDPDASATIDTVEKVDCEDPHDNEVYLVQDYTESPTFPGDAVMMQAADTTCLDAFEPYVGTPYAFSHYDFFTLFPSQGSWNFGDRSIVCALFDLFEHKTTGSAAGTAE